MLGPDGMDRALLSRYTGEEHGVVHATCLDRRYAQ